MESDCFVNVEPFNGSDALIGLIVSTQKHTLTEEDRRILDNRETLQNQLETLQNAETNISGIDCTLDSICDGNTKSALTEATNDVTRMDTDDLELLMKSTELNNSCNTNQIADECIIKYIPENDVKNDIVLLTAQIAVNTNKRQSAVVEAKTLFFEKQQLVRRLKEVEKRLRNYSAEEEEIRKARRKKGQYCVITGPMKRTYFIRFGIPYFKSTYRFPSHLNPELRYLTSIDQVFTFKLPPKRRFLPKHMVEFDEKVLAQLRTKRIQKLERNLNALLKANDKITNEVHEQRRTIEREIERTRNVKNLQDTIDWNIAVDFNALPESLKYDKEDYERFWNLISRPTLSRETFTEQETEKLCNLVEEHGAQDWDRLADLLGTNRSGFVCFAKYAMMKLHRKYVPWTSEEDELLLELCVPMQNAVNEERSRLWNIVCSHFPQRSAHSLHAHWSYHLNPIWKKGKFTQDEHKRVFDLRNQGKSFVDISKIIGNRSSKQIRSHLEGATMTKMKIGVWTTDEDKRLMKAIKKHGESSWVHIAEDVKTRSRHQCRLRYYWIKNEEDTAKPKCKREYWSPEEEEQLDKLFKKFGSRYYLISRHMENRTAKQIRYKCYSKLRKKANETEKLKDDGTETSAKDDKTKESKGVDVQMRGMKNRTKQSKGDRRKKR